MKSTLKRVIVYDLETGGLKHKYNSITEIAMVAIDLETLKQIDEFSVLLKPRIDLSNMEKDALKEAKELYKRLGEKDEDTGIKTLVYGSHKITLNNIQPLVDGVVLFKELIEKKYKSGILEIDDLRELLRGDLKDIAKVYLENAYNSKALAVTKIPLKMLAENGVDYKEAFTMCNDFIKKHTVGNSKPIMAGHNVGWLPSRLIKNKEVEANGFDNPFMDVFFKNNKSDFFASVNDIFYDTLQMARLKFTDLSSYSLGAVANELGLTLKEAHRALPDTKSNAEVLIKMIRSLRGDGSNGKKIERKKYSLNY